MSKPFRKRPRDPKACSGIAQQVATPFLIANCYNFMERSGTFALANSITRSGNPRMPLFIRPNEFTQPDYTVIYRADDDRQIDVGRIFRAGAGVPTETPWVWSVEFHQRKGRAEPHQGNAATEAEAKAAWRGCWNSADVPVRWPPALTLPKNPA